MNEEKTIGDICHDAFWFVSGDEIDPKPASEAWEAAASAVWDKAVEECAKAIKEVEAELAAEGEVYILVKTVEALRSLKHSDKTESDNG